MSLVMEAAAPNAEVMELLAPHPNSGRVGSLHYVFKVVAWGCANYRRYNPTLTTIGGMVRDYGYSKMLGERKTRELVTKLVIAGLVTRKRVGRLYRYSLTREGLAAYNHIAGHAG